MSRSQKTRLGVAVVVGAAVAAAGASVAAGKLHGSAPSTRSGLAAAAASYADYGGAPGGFGHHGDHQGGNPLADAATYLGKTDSELRTALESGKTLAQIADATSGKSAAGLVEALVAAEKTRVDQAVKDGHLTQAQADQITAGSKDRITNLVNGTFPRPGFGHHFGHGPGDDLDAAATYLGTSASDLMTKLQAGKTLAQVAGATSGKSAAGLVDALVTHEKAELAQKVKDGELTQAQSDQLSAGLKQRFTDLVNGTGFRGGFGFGHDHGFGPPPDGNGPPTGGGTPTPSTHI